jgi:predicted neuraminidase
VITRSFVTLDEGAQCHASTVAVVGGRPVVAWFAGTREGTPDNRIHIAGPAGIRALDTGDRLLVSYTWQRRGIVLAEVPVSALMVVE